jgi:hypothetical protein
LPSRDRRDFCRKKRTDCHKRLCRAVRVPQVSSYKEEQTSGVAIFEIIGFRCMNPSVVMQVNGIEEVVGSIQIGSTKDFMVLVIRMKSEYRGL